VIDFPLHGNMENRSLAIRREPIDSHWKKPFKADRLLPVHTEKGESNLQPSPRSPRTQEALPGDPLN